MPKNARKVTVKIYVVIIRNGGNMFTKEAQELAPKVYEAIKKISKGKWEWKPEVGERYISDNDVRLIYDLWKDKDYGIQIHYYDTKHNVHRCEEAEYVIPLLHWERIRKILKQFDYSFSITSGASGGEITVYKTIGTNKLYEKYHNNDLQCAVMRAVIELGKEQ